MTLEVIRPGAQATLQARARAGLRHLGIPAAGPADALSMALANRLVGNASDACAIEITYGNAAFRCLQDAVVAVTGATAAISVAGQAAEMHRALRLHAGEELELGPVNSGVRLYLAIAGGFEAQDAFGSRSTFLPAAFGGFEGRSLRSGDVLAAPRCEDFAPQKTPLHLRPHMARSHALRCAPGPEIGLLDEAIWTSTADSTARLDRTGIELTGAWPSVGAGGQKPSEAVFPGAIQLTPSGSAFLLLTDSQTTGGYPHVLQVIRADRHLTGQIGPHNKIRFMRRTPDEAAADLRAKAALFRDWLPDFRF